MQIIQKNKVNYAFTKVIDDLEDADRAIIEFVKRTKEKIDFCVSSTAPSVFIEIKAIKDARIAAFKNRGVKLRYVIEITADNLEYSRDA